MWWAELVIALRVLLFTIPVFFNKFLDPTPPSASLDERFILILTFTAVYYFLTGLMSLMGLRFWRTLHFIAVLFTLLLAVMAGSLNPPGPIPGAGMGMHFYYPFIFAVIIAVFTLYQSFAGMGSPTFRNSI
jgi:hypothetical protein